MMQSNTFANDDISRLILIKYSRNNARRTEEVLKQLFRTISYQTDVSVFF